MNIGDYVRTKKGYMGKLITEFTFENYRAIYPEPQEWVLDINGVVHVLTEDVDVPIKSSQNIIDLIEAGDVVTTNNLCGEVTKIDIKNNKIWVACCDYETCRIEDIKSIVTKEQFASMKYKLGDK